MPLFGAHMSIAGGYHKAVNAAVEHGMDTFQMFTSSPQMWVVTPRSQVPKTAVQSGKFLTKNNNQWAAKEITLDDIKQFKDALKLSRLKFATAHDSYLINLASSDPVLYERSLEAFAVEVERAEALGLTYLVMHPGTPTDDNENAGLDRIVRALDEVHQRCRACKVKILLETTAGQGMSLGHRFEHLAAILDRVQEPKRLGVCLDTCHVFAAGYSLAPEVEYNKTFKLFAKIIGFSKLKCFHMNDSKKPLGSRVDRHEHIGEGQIGIEAFRLLVNDHRFAKIPMIMETPKEGPGGEDMDIVNLKTLRDLVGKKK